MKNSAKFVIVVILVGILALAAMRLMKKEPPIEPVPLPNVSVEKPVRGDITLETGLIGTVNPSDIMYVTPKVAGDIAETFVEEGDVVAEGQKLCRIDNAKQIDSARIQMNSAQVSLQNAQSTLARMQVLYSTGDISAQVFEQTQTQASAAQLQYQAAKLAYDTQVEYSTVTAPISGRLENVSMDLHSTVAQSSVLCMITGEGMKKVVFSVPERLKENLELGGRIRLEKQGTQYQAVVTKVANMVSAQTGLFEIEATIENGQALAAGSTVKLYVISDHTEGAVTVPVDAVYYDGGDAYLYTCKDGIIHRLLVKTGIFDEERIEILSGITMEDDVVVTWSSELYEGSQVNVVTGGQRSGSISESESVVSETEPSEVNQTAPEADGEDASEMEPAADSAETGAQ